MSVVSLVVSKYGISQRLLDTLSRLTGLSRNDRECVIDCELERLGTPDPDRALLKALKAKFYIENGNHPLAAGHVPGGGEDASEVTKGLRPATTELLSAASHIRSVTGSTLNYEELIRISQDPHITIGDVDGVIEELTAF